MIYHDKSIYIDVLVQHLQSLQVLAKERDIHLTLERGFLSAAIREFDDLYITELILLIGRIIDISDVSSKIIIHPNKKGTKNQQVWCTLECNGLNSENTKELAIGLDVNYIQILRDQSIRFDFLLQEKGHTLQSLNGPQLKANSPKHEEQFHINLSKSLKNHPLRNESVIEFTARKSLEEKVFLNQVNTVAFENLDNAQFSTDDLSKTLNISRAQLYRKFITIVKQSPANYIRYIRMKAAKKMLESKIVSIGNIAFEVGYHDQSHFTRAFKKQFGNSPTFYRNEKESHPKLSNTKRLSIISQEEKNKAFILKYYSALYGVKKTESLVRKYVSDQKLIDHILYFEKLFPSAKIMIEELLTEGNKVFVKARFFGQHAGEIDGIPPTYKEIKIPFAISYTIENDKIIDFWTVANQIDLMNQLKVEKE